MQTEQVATAGLLSNRWVRQVVVFVLVAAAGLFYVKWYPYWHKAFQLSVTHSIGKSILTGGQAVVPAPSWEAAWGYAVAYYKSVWQAVILGLMLGSLVQVLIPRQWLANLVGKADFRSTLLGSLAAVPGMMCSCCAAPVAVGLRKNSASAGAALAFWLANPVLNPATMIFMGFVLSWKWAALRLVMGLVLVLAISYLASRSVTEPVAAVSAAAATAEAVPEQRSFGQRWLSLLWSLTVNIVPAYVIAVLVLGAARAWLFPAVDPAWGDSFAALVLLAVAGTLFVIPTAAEIPIVQTLMSSGLGVGPAAALMMTLPAVSVPSLLMMRRSFDWRTLGFVTGGVIAVGIVSGVVARFVL